jgi:antirestriction protein
MKIFVGTYRKWNNRNLAGEWLNISDFDTKEDFLAAAAEIHKDEADPELMFQDYEGIAQNLISESFIHDVVFEIAKLDQETIENFNAFAQTMDSASFESFQEAFCGRFESELDYAESLVEETGMLSEMPESLRYYFDYKKYARDLFITDVYFHDKTGCVFYRNF